MGEIDIFISQIEKGIAPLEVGINGIKVGDAFDPIPNEDTSSVTRETVKIWKSVSYYRAEDGSDRVEEIFLPIPFFAGHHQQVFQTLEKQYGPPYFIYTMMGAEYHYYSEEGMTVQFSASNKGREIVLYIGGKGGRVPIFKPQKLLDLYVNFILCYSEFNPIEDFVAKNPTSLIQQESEVLLALIKAFTESQSIRSFEDRSFIDRRDLSEYDPVIKEIMTSVNANAGKYKYYQFRPLSEKIRSIDLMVLFQSLLSFYIAYKRYRKRSEWSTTGFWGYEYANILKTTVNEGINTAQISKIEDLLAILISPNQQEFDLKTMIEVYGYPNIDIELMRVNQQY